MDGLAGPYAAFIQAAAASGAAVPDTGASGAPRPRVLDLASGSGVPATTLARGLRARPDGPALALSLTDLVPRPDVWAALAEVAAGEWAAVGAPVDAAAPPPSLARGAALTMVTAFHHLPPPVAAGAFRAAASAGAAGFFVAEPFDRDLRGFLPLLAVAPGVQTRQVAAMAARDARAAWAAGGLAAAARSVATTLALAPPAIALGTLDGIISVLRTYTEAELRCLAAPLAEAGWALDFGYAPFLQWGRGYYFAATAP